MKSITHKKKQLNEHKGFSFYLFYLVSSSRGFKFAQEANTPISDLTQFFPIIVCFWQVNLFMMREG